MTAKDKDLKEVKEVINEVHTYPDGTQVVGTPPFPKESPKERSVTGADGEMPRPMHVPPGRPTSGEAVSQAGPNSAEVFKERVEQQLQADVASGKEPGTPNPTTASDKPELADVAHPDELDGGTLAPLSEDDIAKAAKGVNVKGATEEQKEAAALQVARETKGVIPTGNKKK